MYKVPAILCAAAVVMSCGPSYDATLVPVTTLAGTKGAVHVPKVARRGDVLYLCDDHLGLSVWDVSKPEAPTRLSVLPDTYDNIYKMEIEGDQLHILADRGPSVYDIRQPRSPTVVFTGAGARDVAVLGDYVYLASANGVSLLRLSPGGSWRDLAQGSSLAALAQVGERSLLAVGRNYDESADENFVVWDVTVPGEPRQIYSERVDGMLDDIAVLGEIAYIAAPDLGVLVYDLSNPAAPRRLARLSGMDAFNVYVDPESRQLLVQANNRAVYVLDISDPRQPRPRAMYETSASGIAAAPSGHIVVGNFAGVEMMRLQPR